MATGNTIGKLQYAPAPQGHVAAGSANPPKKKSWWSSYGDWVRTCLDVSGVVPMVQKLCRQLCGFSRTTGYGESEVS
ncbi:hypothetical protein QF006_002325 [Pantoea agglomerans]|nr:hypothetical protein [Pantoea agglomerans]MDQ0433255.1 hypothetical protein [Pantoea agglomerans]